jgi:hypothetical protein
MFASVAKLQVGIAKNKTNQIMFGLTILFFEVNWLHWAEPSNDEFTP